MKTKQQIISDALAVLAELQHGVNENLKDMLSTELRIYCDILGEDLPEEYWEQVEEFI